MSRRPSVRSKLQRLLRTPGRLARGFSRKENRSPPTKRARRSTKLPHNLNRSFGIVDSENDRPFKSAKSFLMFGAGTGVGHRECVPLTPRKDENQVLQNNHRILTPCATAKSSPRVVVSQVAPSPRNSLLRNAAANASAKRRAAEACSSPFSSSTGTTSLPKGDPRAVAVTALRRKLSILDDERNRVAQRILDIQAMSPEEFERRPPPCGEVSSRFFRHAIDLFNSSGVASSTLSGPDRAIDFLIQCGFFPGRPSDIAFFLRTTKGLDRGKVIEYLGSKTTTGKSTRFVRRAYLAQCYLPLDGLDVLQALRCFCSPFNGLAILTVVHREPEAAMMRRLFATLAEQFVRANPGILLPNVSDTGCESVDASAIVGGNNGKRRRQSFDRTLASDIIADTFYFCWASNGLLQAIKDGVATSSFREPMTSSQDEMGNGYYFDRGEDAVRSDFFTAMASLHSKRVVRGISHEDCIKYFESLRSTPLVCADSGDFSRRQETLFPHRSTSTFPTSTRPPSAFAATISCKGQTTATTGTAATCFQGNFHPIDGACRSGLLLKLNRNMKWDRRRFVLRDRGLFWFDKPDTVDREPCGVVLLPNVTASLFTDNKRASGSARMGAEFGSATSTESGDHQRIDDADSGGAVGARIVLRGADGGPLLVAKDLSWRPTFELRFASEQEAREWKSSFEEEAKETLGIPICHFPLRYRLSAW